MKTEFFSRDQSYKPDNISTAINVAKLRNETGIYLRRIL